MRHALAFTLLLVFASLPAHADTVDPLPARLPSGMSAGTAVWAADAMYVFGGYDAWGPDGAERALKTIARYDPATQTVTIMEAQLPHGGWYRSSVWTGERVYVFGGNGYSDYLRDIVEYDPATDSARLLETKLPQRTQGMAAVWTGSVAYLLGGDPYDDGVMYRFEPATETLTRLPHTLPEGHGKFATGVWHDGAAYLLGGYHDEGRSILRVEPETGNVSIFPHRLPSGVFWPQVAVDGPKVYLAGGAGWDEVVRIDLAAAQIAIMPGRVPGGGGKVMAWDGATAHVFPGGGCAPRETCERAYAYTPQAVLPRPGVTLPSVEYSLWQEDDGTWDASFWVDVTVEGAPIYGSHLLAATTVMPVPDPLDALGHGDAVAPLLGERVAIDWFRIPRHEVGTLHRLLYVLEDVQPLPNACVRLAAQSGNTEFGPVASPRVCVELSSMHPAR